LPAHLIYAIFDAYSLPQYCLEVRMTRKLALVFVGLYLALASITAGILIQASPGPKNQEIFGVGIGSYGSSEGIAYISGRRFDCVSVTQPSPFRSHCSISIADKQLTILARRNDTSHPDQLGGVCQADYDGQTWPCSINSRHVHVHWFAYIDTPLNLSASQLDTLREQYWIENLEEAVFLQLIPISVVLTTLAAAVAATLWVWPSRRSKFAVLGIASIASVLACVSSGVAMLFVTAGFWD
jgi:hypothetical protein